MPIVSHTTESIAGHNVLRMLDQNGFEYTVSFFAGPSEVSAIAATQLTQMNALLAESEFERIVGEA